MKNTPLLMIQDMVSKTLEDLKTMTRRVLKEPFEISASGFITKRRGNERFTPYECPYGKPGDRLWIKETHYRYGKWIKNGLSKTGRQKWKFKPLSNEIKYFDSVPDMLATGRRQGWHKRPSIFMPKWATRLWLEITDIRVERLHDISEKDAEAEGVETNTPDVRDGEWFHYGRGLDDFPAFSAKESFESLWDLINAERNGGAYAWDKNPWVWVITFKRVDNGN